MIGVGKDLIKNDSPFKKQFLDFEQSKSKRSNSKPKKVINKKNIHQNTA